MITITKMQKSLIEDIESKLKICFSGDDRTHASKFIHQNIKALRKVNKKVHRINTPTGRQLRYIKKVEKEDGTKFRGSSFEDAMEFIGEHKLSQEGIY